MQAAKNILSIGVFLLTACFFLSKFGLPGTVSSPLGYLTTQGLRSSSKATMSSQSKKNAAAARYNGPDPEHLDENQQEIYDYILRSRPRTGLSGPFGPWLAVPEIAKPASELGKACRYDTSLSFRESELVILLTGAKARSPTEFRIHTGEALKAGIPREVIDGIPRDDDFSVESVRKKLLPILENDREKAIVAFAAELLDTSSVSDETYESTKAVLEHNDSVLVEVTSIVGYYVYVCYTLNVFRIPAK